MFCRRRRYSLFSTAALQSRTYSFHVWAVCEKLEWLLKYGFSALRIFQTDGFKYPVLIKLSNKYWHCTLLFCTDHRALLIACRKGNITTLWNKREAITWLSQNIVSNEIRVVAIDHQFISLKVLSNFYRKVFYPAIWAKFKHLLVLLIYSK